MTVRDVSRRDLLKGLGGAASAGVLSGCSTTLADDDVEPQSLRVALPLAPLALDPVTVDDPWTEQVVNRVFEGLYAYDQSMELVPVLAAGEPTREDSDRQSGENTPGSARNDTASGGSAGSGPTYVVELRDATFQNGEPVTAEDVAYTYDALDAGEEYPRSWLVSMLTDVTAVGEQTVAFSLAHPYPERAFEYVLTQPIVPKSARKGNERQFARKNPVGSGPFEAEEIAPNSYTRLVAWPDYWRNVSPGVAEATFVQDHSGLARTMSLKTGQNDIVERIQPKLWSVTETMPNAHVAKEESYNSVYVGFNCNDGPMTDPETREAVDLLFDMDEVVEHFVGQTGKRQYSPLPRRLARDWDFPVDEWETIPRRKHLDDARRIFQKTVVGDPDTPSGWQPTVAVPKHDMLREKVAETIVDGLRDAGFGRARVHKYPWSKFREKTRTGSSDDYDIFVGSWAGGLDPDTFLYPLFHENNEGLTNRTFYRNESVMNELAQARETTDRAERRRRYTSAITTLLEDRVHLPAFTLSNTFGIKDRIHGFDPHPLPAANPRMIAPDGSRSLSERP